MSPLPKITKPVALLLFLFAFSVSAFAAYQTTQKTLITKNKNDTSSDLSYNGQVLQASTIIDSSRVIDCRVPSINQSVEIPVANGGFESTILEEYGTYGAAEFKQVSGVSRTGNRSISITHNGGSNLLFWFTKNKSIPAVPGKEYTVSAWIKTENIQDYAELALTFWSGNMVKRVGYFKSAPYTQNTTEWTKITTTGVAPADAANIRLEMRLYNPGTVYYDDLQLFEIIN